MVLDFDSAETPLPAHADVCVVGAGAAGIALATSLAAAGRTVLLLEGGGATLEAPSQELYRSDTSGVKHRGVHEGRFRTYGGSTTRWGGQVLELQTTDFERRAWVEGSGWPFPKSELAPYYERALRFEGLRTVARADDEVWRALRLDTGKTAIAREALAPELAMLYSRWLPEVNVGTLHDKVLRSSRRLSVYLHASAVRFRMKDSGDAVQSVVVSGFSGRTAELSADAFVLCLGGIETTRFLLQPPTHGTLPWQQSPALGRYFQDHLSVKHIPLRSLRSGRLSDTFGYVMSRGFRYHNRLWLTPMMQERLRTLNVAGTVVPWAKERPARAAAIERLNTLVQGRAWPGATEALRLMPHAVAEAAERIGARFGGETRLWRRSMLTVECEQAPQSGSSISLTDERDAMGMLRTRLDWKISAAELHTLRSYVRVASDVFAREELARVDVPHEFYDDDELLRAMCADSFHHMGSTRMATSAAGGVVDTDLRLHGVQNAYVASASVFPTSGFSNPTHTVVALALRLSDRLAGAASSATEVRAPIAALLRQIVLPDGKQGTTHHVTHHAPHHTTQLGFGCAYLMVPGVDVHRSRRLLDAAWDAGIRHFDSAPMYGMGRSEALLGEFLALHPEATVTTKFGLRAPSLWMRNLMHARRMSPHMERLLRKPDDRITLNARGAERALEASLRALRRDRVDLYLLHEATAEQLTYGNLLEFLTRKREEGVIGNFGVGGDSAHIPQLLQQRAEYAPVLQFGRSLLSPVVRTDKSWCAYYQTFAGAASSLHARLESDPETLRRWSNTVGADLREPGIVAQLMLRGALDAWPAALQLFSSQREERIFANVVAATAPKLGPPAKRLCELVRDHNL